MSDIKLKRQSYAEHERKKQEKMRQDEETDQKKQAELQQLKNSILKVAQHDLLKGYTEVLVGEKNKAYENEEDTQKVLEFQQKNIKLLIRENNKLLKVMEDPNTIKYRKTTTVDQEIDECEANLKNPYYQQLAKVWLDDVSRQRRESSTFSPLKRIKQQKSQFELTQDFMKSNPNFKSCYQNAPRSMSTVEKQPFMATSPVALFSKQRGSDIAKKNLELINEAPSRAYESKLQNLSNHRSEVRFNQSESRGIESPLQMIKAQRKFASPLNNRLEEMKNNLHHLMFNTGLSQSLIYHEPPEEINVYRRDPQMQELQKQILMELQETDEGDDQDEIQRQNYNLLSLEPVNYVVDSQQSFRQSPIKTHLTTVKSNEMPSFEPQVQQNNTFHGNNVAVTQATAVKSQHTQQEFDDVANPSFQNIQVVHSSIGEEDITAPHQMQKRLTIDNLIENDQQLETEQMKEDLQEDDTQDYEQQYLQQPPLIEYQHPHKVIHSAQQINSNNTSQSDLREKAFEQDFNLLVNRVNTNLIQSNRSDLVIETKTRKEQSPFKSSQISFIQSLISHRDQYAQRLRHFDQAKSTQSHQFIRQKIQNYEKQPSEMAMMFGPIKQDESAIKISGDAAKQMASDNSFLLNQQPTAHTGINFSAAEIAPIPFKNMNRINSPSTDLNSQGSIMKADLNTKIENQVKLNQLSQKKFLDYVKNVKKISKNGLPMQLQIDLVANSKKYESQQHHYTDQEGSIQYQQEFHQQLLEYNNLMDQQQNQQSTDIDEEANKTFVNKFLSKKLNEDSQIFDQGIKIDVDMNQEVSATQLKVQTSVLPSQANLERKIVEFDQNTQTPSLIGSKMTLQQPEEQPQQPPKKAFQSIQPKLVNQLLILPDMSILSPLQVLKMSPSTITDSKSKLQTAKNIVKIDKIIPDRLKDLPTEEILPKTSSYDTIKTQGHGHYIIKALMTDPSNKKIEPQFKTFIPEMSKKDAISKQKQEVARLMEQFQTSGQKKNLMKLHRYKYNASVEYQNKNIGIFTGSFGKGFSPQASVASNFQIVPKQPSENQTFTSKLLSPNLSRQSAKKVGNSYLKKLDHYLQDPEPSQGLNSVTIKEQPPGNIEFKNQSEDYLLQGPKLKNENLSNLRENISKLIESRKNDPRVIYSNAKREKELIEKRQRIKEEKMRSKLRKEQIKEQKGILTTNKSVGIDIKANNYKTVQINSLLTLEELLKIHTQQVNEKMGPVTKGAQTTMNKGTGQWPSGEISIHTLQKDERKFFQNSDGFVSQRENPSSRVETLAGAMRSKLSTMKNSKNNLDQLYEDQITLMQDDKAVTPKNNKIMKVISSPRRKGSNSPFIPSDKSKSKSPKDKKQLNLTLQPFKGVLITNPWQQNEQIPEALQKQTIPTEPVSKALNARSRISFQGIQKSPSGVFKNSPNKTAIVKKQNVRQSVSSSKIQGFGPISNATNTQFIGNVPQGELSSNKEMDVHIVTHQDFTIEEKMNEESYLSKDNFVDKTMEYKNTSVRGQNNAFSHSARDTANMFTEAVNTEIRNGEQDLIPKIKIENNQHYTEVNSDAPAKTPN